MGLDGVGWFTVVKPKREKPKEKYSVCEIYTDKDTDKQHTVFLCLKVV